MTSNRKGYRGYMGARMEMGRSIPQNVQQLVIRDYCTKRNMQFLLSATEYCMKGCTLMLDTILADLASLEGIVMYSIYQMPTDKQKRRHMYEALFAKNCELHCAAENIAIRNWSDANRIEDTWDVATIINHQKADILSTLQSWDKESA